MNLILKQQCTGMPRLATKDKDKSSGTVYYLWEEPGTVRVPDRVAARNHQQTGRYAYKFHAHRPCHDFLITLNLGADPRPKLVAKKQNS